MKSMIRGRGMSSGMVLSSPWVQRDSYLDIIAYYHFEKPSIFSCRCAVDTAHSCTVSWQTLTIHENGIFSLISIMALRLPRKCVRVSDVYCTSTRKTLAFWKIPKQANRERDDVGCSQIWWRSRGRGVRYITPSATTSSNSCYPPRYPRKWRSRTAVLK